MTTASPPPRRHTPGCRFLNRAGQPCPVCLEQEREYRASPPCPFCGIPIGRYGIDGHCSFHCAMQTRLGKTTR